MSYKIKSRKKIDLSKVKLDVEISNNFLKKNIGKAYKNISEKANIPGFRKGKVPQQVIDVNFGKQYVLNEAASISISELYPDIITESSLDPIDYPRIKITQLKEELPLGFEVELELEPEIELPSYRGIKVTGYSTDVSEEELDRQIDNIRNNFASLEPVIDDRPVSKGDYVTLDFNGKIDGEEFEGGSAEEYLLEVGSNTLFPEFEDSLVGMKKGTGKDITLVLPENIKNRELAGKKADFNVFIKEIKRKVLPELDEDFLKNIGDYKDVDDFKNSVKEKLVEQKKNMRKSRIVEEVLNHIMSNMKSKVPQVMITRRMKQVNEEINENLKKQKITKENYLKMINITEDQFNGEIKEKAEKEVKEYLIFKALEKAEKKNIEPSEDEINKEKENIINSYSSEEDVSRVKEFLKNENGKKALLQSIRRKKIVDLLINSVKVVEEKDAGGKDKKKIWKPEKNKEQAEKEGKKLWTPGSK